MPSYHVSEVTGNGKLGGITTTTTDRASCSACPLKDNGCYADNFPLSLHWDKVTEGERGTGSVDQHCEEIYVATGRTGMVRHCQAGELPGKIREARKVCEAHHEHAVSFTFSHRRDRRWLRAVNSTRTTVNVSANTLAEADRYAGEFPTVTLLPNGAKRSRTPEGRIVVRCPAEYRDVTCRTCGGGDPLCARKDRSFIVGFTPHGSQARKAREVAVG